MNGNKSEFEAQKEVVMAELEKLASMTPGGGLYVEDIDCARGLYALQDITLDDEGHVRLEASMWTPTSIACKTGYFRGD